MAKKPSGSERNKKKVLGSNGENHRIGKTIGSKIVVKEEYDREMAQIAVSKIESVAQMWERAKYQCYYSHLETLLKTDQVFKILRPK